MGFSATWLDLREPADRRARDRGLMLAAAVAAGPRPVVADLGCGTGATMRAMAACLPGDTRWRLIDRDADLLGQVVPATSITCHAADLAELDRLPLAGATLVTASALLDLMPEAWIAALVESLAARALPFYAALSYDGAMTWQPPLSGDDPVTRAFNRHQQGDKGLGPAMGPSAVECAARYLAAAGYEVRIAPSPWLLGPTETRLQNTLLDGIAAAAGEAGCTEAADWRDKRLQEVPRAECRIGHLDLLALPRE